MKLFRFKMKPAFHSKLLFVLFFILRLSDVKSQCVPTSLLGSVQVTPLKAVYCPNDNIKFDFVQADPADVIQSNLVWQYGGTANATSLSGTDDITFKVDGIQTGGTVKVEGVIKTKAGFVCAFDIIFNVVMTDLTADAGPDLYYTGGTIVLGPSTCGLLGTAPYSYVWTPSGSIVGSNTICGPSAAPLTTTNYILTVSDANGCYASDQVLVINLPENISYIIPEKSISAGYQVKKNNKIYFAYEEEYRKGTLTYKILDYAPASVNIQPPSIACALSSSAAKNLGDNRYYIDLSSCSLTSSKFYVVEITNDKNEKSYFKFKN